MKRGGEEVVDVVRKRGGEEHNGRKEGGALVCKSSVDF